MNQPKSPNSQLLQFMLRAQQLARQDVKTDKGYAMMMTSIITIMLFSLMGAFLTMTNIAKSSTDAYLDGNNTFYAAESGLNKRAGELYQIFRNYNSPDGSTSPTTAMSTCYGSTNSDTKVLSDLECRSYDFQYNNNIAKVASSDPNSIVLSEGDGTTTDRKSSVKYKAYTFVSDKTNYDNTVTPPAPISSTIPAGSTYAGLFAQEYIYTVSATAAKLNDNLSNNTSQIGSSGDNKTVLQMDFKSRTIPLFQFGAFYEGDLELNPSRRMSFNGRLHTNSNMYLTSGVGSTNVTVDGVTTRVINNLTIDGAVTAVERINTGNPALTTAYANGSTGQIRIEKTAGAQTHGSSLASSLEYLPSTSTPKTQAEVSNLTPYNQRLKSRLGNKLIVPAVAFLTKTDDTKPNNIGEYYGKADLRLEMFPNKSVPFKLQAISTGASTTCTTADKVSEGRAEYSSLKCTDLNEGQLRSLMQPVLVRPRSTSEYTAFCTNTGVGTPPQAGTAVNIGTTAITTSTAPADLVIKERILDALYLTLSAQTTPVAYSTLTTSLSPGAQAQFRELLTNINIPGLTATDLDTLAGQAPRDIAALTTKTDKDNNIIQPSCFRPAPIQALFDPSSFSPSGALAADTPTNFKDRRENRYIRMLQTNIESLTLWNRDNVFTQGLFDENLTTPNATTPEAVTPAALAAKFTIDNSTKAWAESSQSRTDNILFQRASADTSAPVGSFRNLGLAARDRTEGGLVIHATIDRTSATGTPAYDYTARTSPYGFAFNDGANLPAPLTIVTDQAAYSQGNWNTVDKQPASFLADTITVLSNSCLNKNVDTPATATLPPSLVGQLNCGSLSGIPSAGSTTLVNAAFLARTDKSIPSTDVTVNYYSGGLNNYIRILEDWTGAAMTYRGSLVSLGEPLEVSGRYKECKTLPATEKLLNYACPASLRDWDYDTSFNSYQGLPPLPPRVIELTQDSFKRKFN